MAETGIQSDKSLGLGLVFGMIAAVGALVMFVESANNLLAGWGFALAVIAGSIAIASIHIFS